MRLGEWLRSMTTGQKQQFQAWGTIAAIAAGLVLLGNATKAYQALAEIAPWVTEVVYAQDSRNLSEPLINIQEQIAVIRIDQLNSRIESLNGELIWLDEMLERNPGDSRLTIRRSQVLASIAQVTEFKHGLECRVDPFSHCPPVIMNGDNDGRPGG